MTGQVKTAAMLGAIYADLRGWAKEVRAEVELIHNPYRLLAVIGNTPTNWRLLIHWLGDSPQGSATPTAPVLDNRLMFIFHGDLGPTAEVNANLVKPTAARNHAFLEIKDALCERLDSYRFPWLRPPNNRMMYLACDDKLPLPDGTYLAAYNVQYKLMTVRPQPAREIELHVEGVSS